MSNKAFRPPPKTSNVANIIRAPGQNPAVLEKNLNQTVIGISRKSQEQSQALDEVRQMLISISIDVGGGSQTLSIQQGQQPGAGVNNLNNQNFNSSNTAILTSSVVQLQGQQQGQGPQAQAQQTGSHPDLGVAGISLNSQSQLSQNQQQSQQQTLPLPLPGPNLAQSQTQSQQQTQSLNSQQQTQSQPKEFKSIRETLDPNILQEVQNQNSQSGYQAPQTSPRAGDVNRSLKLNSSRKSLKRESGQDIINSTGNDTVTERKNYQDLKSDNIESQTQSQSSNPRVNKLSTVQDQNNNGKPSNSNELSNIDDTNRSTKPLQSESKTINTVTTFTDPQSQTVQTINSATVILEDTQTQSPPTGWSKMMISSPPASSVGTTPVYTQQTVLPRSKNGDILLRFFSQNPNQVGDGSDRVTKSSSINGTTVVVPSVGIQQQSQSQTGQQIQQNQTQQQNSPRLWDKESLQAKHGLNQHQIGDCDKESWTESIAKEILMSRGIGNYSSLGLSPMSGHGKKGQQGPSGQNASDEVRSQSGSSYQQGSQTQPIDLTGLIQNVNSTGNGQQNSTNVSPQEAFRRNFTGSGKSHRMRHSVRNNQGLNLMQLQSLDNNNVNESPQGQTSQSQNPNQQYVNQNHNVMLGLGQQFGNSLGLGGGHNVNLQGQQNLNQERSSASNNSGDGTVTANTGPGAGPEFQSTTNIKSQQSQSQSLQDNRRFYELMSLMPGASGAIHNVTNGAVQSLVGPSGGPISIHTTSYVSAAAATNNVATQSQASNNNSNSTGGPGGPVPGPSQTQQSFQGPVLEDMQGLLIANTIQGRLEKTLASGQVKNTMASAQKTQSQNSEGSGPGNFGPNDSMINWNSATGQQQQNSQTQAQQDQNSYQQQTGPNNQTQSLNPPGVNLSTSNTNLKPSSSATNWRISGGLGDTKTQQKERMRSSWCSSTRVQGQAGGDKKGDDDGPNSNNMVQQTNSDGVNTYNNNNVTNPAGPNNSQNMNFNNTSQTQSSTTNNNTNLNQPSSTLQFSQGTIMSSRLSNYLAPSYSYSSAQGCKVTGFIDPQSNTPRIVIQHPRIKHSGPGSNIDIRSLHIEDCLRTRPTEWVINSVLALQLSNYGASLSLSGPGGMKHWANCGALGPGPKNMSSLASVPVDKARKLNAIMLERERQYQIQQEKERQRLQQVQMEQQQQYQNQMQLLQSQQNIQIMAQQQEQIQQKSQIQSQNNLGDASAEWANVFVQNDTDQNQGTNNVTGCTDQNASDTTNTISNDRNDITGSQPLSQNQNLTVETNGLLTPQTHTLEIKPPLSPKSPTASTSPKAQGNSKKKKKNTSSKFYQNLQSSNFIGIERDANGNLISNNLNNNQNFNLSNLNSLSLSNAVVGVQQSGQDGKSIVTVQTGVLTSDDNNEGNFDESGTDTTTQSKEQSKEKAQQLQEDLADPPDPLPMTPSAITIIDTTVNDDPPNGLPSIPISVSAPSAISQTQNLSLPGQLQQPGPPVSTPNQNLSLLNTPSNVSLLSVNSVNTSVTPSQNNSMLPSSIQTQSGLNTPSEDRFRHLTEDDIVTQQNQNQGQTIQSQFVTSKASNLPDPTDPETREQQQNFNNYKPNTNTQTFRSEIQQQRPGTTPGPGTVTQQTSQGLTTASNPNLKTAAQIFADEKKQQQQDFVSNLAAAIVTNSNDIKRTGTDSDDKTNSSIVTAQQTLTSTNITDVTVNDQENKNQNQIVNQNHLQLQQVLHDIVNNNNLGPTSTEVLENTGKQAIVSAAEALTAVKSVLLNSYGVQQQSQSDSDLKNNDNVNDLSADQIMRKTLQQSSTNNLNSSGPGLSMPPDLLVPAVTIKRSGRSDYSFLTFVRNCFEESGCQEAVQVVKRELEACQKRALKSTGNSLSVAVSSQQLKNQSQSSTSDWNNNNNNNSSNQQGASDDTNANYTDSQSKSGKKSSQIAGVGFGSSLSLTRMTSNVASSPGGPGSQQGQGAANNRRSSEQRDHQRDRDPNITFTGLQKEHVVSTIGQPQIPNYAQMHQAQANAFKLNQQNQQLKVQNYNNNQNVQQQAQAPIKKIYSNASLEAEPDGEPEVVEGQDKDMIQQDGNDTRIDKVQDNDGGTNVVINNNNCNQESSESNTDTNNSSKQSSKESSNLDIDDNESDDGIAKNLDEIVKNCDERDNVNRLSILDTITNLFPEDISEKETAKKPPPSTVLETKSVSVVAPKSQSQQNQFSNKLSENQIQNEKSNLQFGEKNAPQPLSEKEKEEQSKIEQIKEELRREARQLYGPGGSANNYTSSVAQQQPYQQQSQNSIITDLKNYETSLDQRRQLATEFLQNKLKITNRVTGTSQSVKSPSASGGLMSGTASFYESHKKELNAMNSTAAPLTLNSNMSTNATNLIQEITNLTGAVSSNVTSQQQQQGPGPGPTLLKTISSNSEQSTTVTKDQDKDKDKEFNNSTLKLPGITSLYKSSSSPKNFKDTGSIAVSSPHLKDQNQIQSLSNSDLLESKGWTQLATANTLTLATTGTQSALSPQSPSNQQTQQNSPAATVTNRGTGTRSPRKSLLTVASPTQANSTAQGANNMSNSISPSQQYATNNNQVQTSTTVNQDNNLNSASDINPSQSQTSTNTNINKRNSTPTTNIQIAESPYIAAVRRRRSMNATVSQVMDSHNLGTTAFYYQSPSGEKSEDMRRLERYNHNHYGHHQQYHYGGPGTGSGQSNFNLSHHNLATVTHGHGPVHGSRSTGPTTKPSSVVNLNRRSSLPGSLSSNLISSNIAANTASGSHNINTNSFGSDIFNSPISPTSGPHNLNFEDKFEKFQADAQRIRKTLDSIRLASASANGPGNSGGVGSTMTGSQNFMAVNPGSV